MILTGCASIGGVQKGKVERISPEELAQLLPSPIATYTLDNIVADAKQGVSPDEMIAKIKESESRYELTTAQVLDLNTQGVETKVLDYIQQSNELAKQNAIADEMNRRQQENDEVKRQLRRERLTRNLYYDPFFGPRYNFFYGRRFPIGPAGRFWPRSRFGWGMSFGHPYGW